ncbi:hypothetical protein [Ammoniphilus sp. YIM 78166]|uniref:hypothetical protein n=1 Tax=Ammoniphilus sp. YIM 78166 TaxID=1644106 RepID=UPI00106FD00E|nr:hypothetical protein [Ammoniphilus sp. YIM 78166]
MVTVKNGDRTQQYTVNLVHADEVGLSTFTIGGMNVNGLAGLTTSQGAVLKVNQSGLKGITLQTKDQEASVTVKVNGTQISSSQLANYRLYAQDVVQVVVKDGTTTQEYKVKLVQAENLSLDRFRINGVDIRNLSGLTTTDGAIVEVQDFSSYNGLEVRAQDSAAVVTVKINDSIYTPSQLSNFPFLSGDRVVVEVKNGSLVET